MLNVLSICLHIIDKRFKSKPTYDLVDFIAIISFCQSESELRKRRKKVGVLSERSSTYVK